MKAKLTFLLIVISLAAGPVHAQRTPAKVQRTATGFLKSPFALQGFKIEPSFKGHSIVEVQAALTRRFGLRVKGEFESTQEYQERLKRLDGTPYLGTLKLDSRLAFVVDAGSAPRAYDADNNTLNIYVSLQNPLEGDHRSSERLSAVITKVAGPSSTYVGQNAFGATATVTQTQEFIYTVAFINHSQMGIADTSASSASLLCEIKMDAATARKIKDRLRVVLVSRLAWPYLTSGMLERKPTLSLPYASETFYSNVVAELLEIWIFDPATGNVPFQSKIVKEQ